MIAVINDLPFQEQFRDKAEAKAKIHQFLMVCRQLESAQASAIDELCGAKIDTKQMVTSRCSLAKLLGEMRNKEEMRYLIHLISHLRNPVEPTTQPFRHNGKESYVCGCVGDGIVVSLEADSGYGGSVLVGTQGAAVVTLKNVAKESQISAEENFFGIRYYEANPKHRQTAYIDTAGRAVSVMDLDAQEAQDTLNHAVCIDGKLYGKRYGKYYCFQNHHANWYHGYQNNNLPLHIRKQIDRHMRQ